MTNNHSTDLNRLERLIGYLEQDNDNWTLRAEIFDLSLALGQIDTALAQVQNALQVQPEDKQWQHRQALVWLAMKRYADAQHVLEALLADGADEPSIRYNLAYALFSQERFEPAIELLEPFLHSHSEHFAMAWVWWLRAQHRLYQLERALTMFQEQEKQASLPADAWGVASLIAIDADNPTQAAQWSARALQQNPDQLEALVAAGSIALLEQDSAALGYFAHALDIHPQDGRSWSGLAFAHLMQSKFDAAAQAFDNAVKWMPTHIGTWIGYGWCQFLMDQPQRSYQSFQQALALDRNFSESHGALAVALVRLERQQEAIEEIDIALKLDSKNLSARYAQAMLSGEIHDTEGFLRLSRRVLGQHSVMQGGSQRSMAEVVLGAKNRRS